MTRKRFLQILTNVFYALGIVVSILFLLIYAFGGLYNDDYHSYRETEMLNNATDPTRFITVWDKDKGEEIPYEFKLGVNQAQSILKKYLQENRAEVLEKMQRSSFAGFTCTPIQTITRGGKAVWTMEFFSHCYVKIDANTGEIADVRLWNGLIP